MTTPPVVSLLPVRDLDFDELFEMFEAYRASSPITHLERPLI